MKILIFTDTHANKKYFKIINLKIKKFNPEMLICLGDFTIFGNNQKKILKEINKFGIKTLLIHGNHEIINEVKRDAKNLKNIIVIHNQIFTINNIAFIGFGGGGFSLYEPDFKVVEKIFKLNKNKYQKVVLLTHAPPYGTKIDLINNTHCGCKTFSSFIKKHEPDFVFSGHLHENNGKNDFKNNSIIINPGPKGKIINLI